MKTLNRRIEALEASSSLRRADLDHLSDAELEQLALGVIEEIASCGVTLPDDWREQYSRSPIRFSQWVEVQA